EEYYHAAIFRKGARHRALTSTAFPSRVEQSVDKLLAIMGEHDATATFFVLGEVAEAHPEMIRKIAAGRHEVACHGDLHEDVRRGIARVNARERRPVMVYLHPWELDSGQPRPSMPWHHRFRHYVGVARHADKVDRLLGHFRFATARQILNRMRPATASAS